MVIVKFAVFVWAVGVVESVTLNVSDVPVVGAVGVPLIRPVDAFSVKPAGSVPEVSVQLYGAVPAANCQALRIRHSCLTARQRQRRDRQRCQRQRYAYARCLCRMTRNQLTANVSGVALAAVTRSATDTPVDEFSVKPAGSVPERERPPEGEVPPVAANVCE